MSRLNIKDLFKGLYKHCECWHCICLIPVITRDGNFSKYKRGHYIRTEDQRGTNGHNYRGGETVRESDKYVSVLARDHPYTRKNGYISKHRLVMEDHLGRLLTKDEVVHHIDGNKENNEINNLMLFPNNAEHMRYEKLMDFTGRYCSHPKCKDPTNPYKNSKGRTIWYNNHNGGWYCPNCGMKEKRKNKNQL